MNTQFLSILLASFMNFLDFRYNINHFKSLLNILQYSIDQNQDNQAFLYQISSTSPKDSLLPKVLKHIDHQRTMILQIKFALLQIISIFILSRHLKS
ncbi:hypothetical protein pb186bvf_010487 [Paramecium bursaria]